MRNEGTPVARDTVDRAEQLSHTGYNRNLRPFARGQETVVVRTQPWVYAHADQRRHPQPMAETRISERKAPSAGERALARLAQTRHHANVTGKRRGIAKAAWVAQLRDQAGGGSRPNTIDASQEFANFMSLKLAFDVLVQLLDSISQNNHIRAGEFDLQLVGLGMMTSH
jgi:hypothetical protein